ncbi:MULTISPECIES: MarR family winged helix-turn-helix transcriptional regulator [Streptomyces]|uniref:MarR family winged helix-turn-helix transcriptional regulator n=1 Tax=Streptomyces TaxID=1883 RepID=UPI000AC078EA|nr:MULTISPECIES: MarR family transcriptional regulator [Streptomyces]
MSTAPEMPSSTVMLMIAAGRQLQRELESDLSAIGLSLRQLGALGHIAHNPELSYSDLARRAGITTQSMRATILMLQEQGAVRSNLSGQGRRANLELTEAGEQLLNEARRVIALRDRAFAERLGAEEEKVLSAVLRRASPGPADTARRG